MKARILLVSLLVGVVCSVWAAEPVPATSASTSAVAQPQPGDPAYGFNWFNPYAWMALGNPAAWNAGSQYAPTTQPAGSAAPAANASYPNFNFFDPNAWMAMFFNPAAWSATTQPGAVPASSTASMAYPNTFNWFNPFAWAAMFTPASQPTFPAAPAK